MARTYQEAVRNGVAAAGRLHRRFDLRAQLEAEPGAVDVFDLIAALDTPLMVRPLDGLLGAFVNVPIPGIMITTERPLSIQRFTAAHELGHSTLGHQPSLDDEDQILRRAPGRDLSPGFQETEADAFAAALLMPRWLITAHCARQGWRAADLARPQVVYQLALRLGVSFEAMTRTLERYDLLDPARRQTVLVTKPRALKIDLLGDFTPPSYHGDVWLLTEKDQGGRIDGSRKDLFVIRVEELGSAGYLWDFDTLHASGLVVLRDTRLPGSHDSVGGPFEREVLAGPDGEDVEGALDLRQSRPWLQEPPIAALAVTFDLSGPEASGLSRAERRRWLAAA
ncbi:ImmA/IrrE family metallo-endopeptidase [Brevundimonas diminuta]|uniref:ImmA/IrrE family metallo-endopeptidase n=1 Tax=Brevundimonas diminuta TaxID=293 RepID=UPI001906E8F7|nr:ImmA/IrrE family metallo-endopeptidase [Brevundimonas diminuta]MBK1967718.1 ImmA/IrrE family metallo-endopeptidase [Brevundimonas diminuta]